MSLIPRKGLLDAVQVCIQAKRFRGKLNVQRPQVPHFERAKFLSVTKPIVLREKKTPITVDFCEKNIKFWSKSSTHNPLQKFYANDVLHLFRTSKFIAFFHMNPMNSEQHYQAYVMFKKQGMEYKNYGKKTLEVALTGTPYQTVLDFYISHNMIVFSPNIEIKKFLKISKKFPQLILLAGILEGRFVSKDEMVHYSNLQNLSTARAELVQTLNAAGGTVVGQLSTHQQGLLAQLSERMKQLEGGSG